MLRYNLHFQKFTLAATTKSKKARLEAERPGPFTMLQEQDGGGQDRSSRGHGSKRIDLKYHLQVEFIGTHLISFSPTFQITHEETGVQGSNVELPSLNGRTTTLKQARNFQLKICPNVPHYFTCLFLICACLYLSYPILNFLKAEKLP